VRTSPNNAARRQGQKEKKMKTNLRSKETIRLQNPWSGSVTKEMTWKQIVNWCKESIHPSDQHDWLKEARKAARNNDEKTLGIMIIGA
jgi:hypothetical protein